MKEGFFKVRQEGGSYVVATFFNPETKESFTKCVRDYDYADCSRDDDELYYAEINEEAKKAWLRHNGVIQIGDSVKVVKGRKVPIGTVAVVSGITKWKDQYGRTQAVYAVLDNGMRTNINNCVLA